MNSDIRDRETALSDMIAIARQRIDDRDLLDREIGYDLDLVFLHDQHLLDTHPVAKPFAVLRFKRKRHAFLNFDRMVERPNTGDDRRIVLRKPKPVAPQVRRGLVFVLVAPRFLR